MCRGCGRPARRTRVVLLTADRDPDTARRAMAAAPRATCARPPGSPRWSPRSPGSRRGEVVGDRCGAPALLRGPEHAEAHRLAGYLTPRERDCLAMMVDGLGTAAIAARLGVSAATVRTYAQAVLTKLGVHSRLEAASFAVRHSLLDTPA